jgi:hypothetical protein
MTRPSTSSGSHCDQLLCVGHVKRCSMARIFLARSRFSRDLVATVHDRVSFILFTDLLFSSTESEKRKKVNWQQRTK